VVLRILDDKCGKFKLHSTDVYDHNNMVWSNKRKCKYLLWVCQIKRCAVVKFRSRFQYVITLYTCDV